MLNVEDRVPLHPGRVELIPVGGDKYDMRRADEPVQEGTPLDRRTMQLLQADRRTYPVAEGEIITAGDVVDVQADGTVGRTILPVSPAKAQGEFVNGLVVSACELTAGKVAVVFNRSGTVYAQIFSVSGGILTAEGEETQIADAVGLAAIDKLSASLFFVTYRTTSSAVALRICAVSGGTVALGSPVQVCGPTTGAYSWTDLCACSMPDGSMIVMCSDVNNYRAELRRITHSGTTANVVATVQMNDIMVANGPCLKAIDATRAILAFSQSKSIGVYYVRTLTVNGSTLSLGNANKISSNSDYTYTNASIAVVGDHMVAVYGSGSAGSLIKAHYLTMPDANGNVTSPVVCILKNDALFYPNLLKVGGNIVLCGCDVNAGRIESYVIRSGDQKISCENAYIAQTYNVRAPACASVKAGDQIVLFSGENNTTKKSDVAILSQAGNQFAYLENCATQAIALQSGNGGQEVEVIFDGVAELPGVTAGQEITSPGVYGYCQRDGWLWVRPEWDKNIVMMEYIGTGTHGKDNPNRLTFFKRPKGIVIQADPGSSNIYGHTDCVWMFGVRRAPVDNVGGSTPSLCDLAWSETGLSWYSTDTSRGGPGQLNANGVAYRVMLLY